MIKEKWPYILVVFLLVGSGFVYLQCQPTKANVSLGNEVVSKETTPEPPVDQSKNHDAPKPDKSQDSDIVIDLKGAVKKPGVYHMAQGDRVVDALEKAGGLTVKADKKEVNFAKKLTDEMMVYIPAIGEKVPDNLADTSTSTPSNKPGSGKININTATEQELEEIPGIGPSKATAIIEYREKNGPYQKLDDLDKVTGFGQKTLERMKDQITVQ